MKFAGYAVVALVGALSGSIAHAEAPPAFPGAEGFGAIATGGRGGEVVIVTNLNDAGPGSLREAVSQSGRIVVFEVGGVITLERPLVIESDITIAGQTAPGDGITLYGNILSCSGKSNIIIRHMRLRAGIQSSRGSKTLNVSNGTKMIFDHLSISWGRWDNLGFTQQCEDLTLQNCIISEAIAPQRFGALIDSSRRISVIRNLWANNQSRNPKGKADMQYINNVVYNFGNGGYVGGHSAAEWKQDLIGNVFIAGPNTQAQHMLSMFSETDLVHHHDNLADLEPDGTLSLQPIERDAYRAHKEQSATFVEQVQNDPPVKSKILPARDVVDAILPTVGASLKRDSIDERIIRQVRSFGTEGAVIQEQAEVGGINEMSTGAAPVDTDRDGIPDAWETANGLNPNDPADSRQIDPNTGYAQIERYINSLVK